MGRIFEAMQGFFDGDGWHPEALDGRTVLRMSFVGDSAQWICFAQAREAQRQALFYSVAPLKVPADRRGAVAEFITRANYGMILGNFELDFEDGEVRYKTSVDLDALLIPDGDEGLHAAFKAMAYANVLSTDRYMPGLMAVGFGDVSPAAALKDAES